jgi:sulfur carrier protein
VAPQRAKPHSERIGRRGWRLPLALGIWGAVKVTVNGEPREVPNGLTVAQLLAVLDVRAVGRVAVEVNTVVVRHAHHEQHRLAEGDQVEIVTFVGGGT